MSAKRFTIDALSRALCPSIDAVLLTQATSSPLPSVGRGLAARSSRRFRPNRAQARLTHTTANDSTADQPTPEHLRVPIHVPLSAPRLSTESKSWTRSGHLLRRPPPESLPIRAHWTHNQLPPLAELPGLNASPSPTRAGLPDWVAEASTSTIYEKLRQLRSSPENGSLIRALVKYLVTQRGESPNVFLYEALVIANWDTSEGSAGELAAIRKEMRTVGVEMSHGFYHSALRVRG